MPITPARVAIVGTGLVGATTAYALLLSGAVPEIVLADKDHERARGHANDLRDAALFAPATRVTAGDLADCATADVIIITAGVQQSATKGPRLGDLHVSAGIVREILSEIGRYDPQGIFVIASNPVDILTYAVWKWAGLPANRVLGSGTTLDSSRFRWRLAERYGVAAEDVRAYIMGEHGDSQVPVVSSARVAGLPLEGFCRAVGKPYEAGAIQAIANETRTAGYEILRAKGATYFGVAAALTRIVGAILRDEHAILTVSTVAPPWMGLGEVCLSLPAIIDRTGVARVLPTALDAAERSALETSAAVLRRYGEQVVEPALT
jgi:L-lactate dehydrogenase